MRRRAGPARSVEHLAAGPAARPERPRRRPRAGRPARQDDPEAWERARALVSPDVPDADTPEDRLARAVVIARHPGGDRADAAISLLQTLLADLPPSRPTAAAARDYLARLLLALDRADEAVQVSAVSAEPGSNPAAVLLHAEALIRARRFAQAEAQLDRLAMVLPGDRREARLRALLIRDRAGDADAPAALLKAVADAGRHPPRRAPRTVAYQLLLAGDPPTSTPPDRSVASWLTPAPPSTGCPPRSSPDAASPSRP